MQTITPFLWFDGKAAEAVAFYRSIFPETEVLRTTGGGTGPAGALISLTFRLLNQEFIAFDGGPHFAFTPAISLFVRCETQDEIDAVWDRLIEGGAPQRCGWLKDRYGLSWQIVPAVLGAMLTDKDPVRANRVMQAMMGMVRLDIAALRRAYDAA